MDVKNEGKKDWSPCCGAVPYGNHTNACDIVTGGGTIEERLENISTLMLDKLVEDEGE